MLECTGSEGLHVDENKSMLHPLDLDQLGGQDQQDQQEAVR